jgi:hypothetical protein
MPGLKNWNNVKAFPFQARGYEMPTSRIDPVVRVLCRMDRGAEMMVSRGSGFFVADWERTIVTASHVVAERLGARPMEIAIDVTIDSGAVSRLWACSVAYPENGVPDVAVVCFAKSRPQLIQSTELDDPPEGEFATTLHGYDSTGRRRQIDVRAVLGEAMIRFTQGSGVEGMSGGPLGLPAIYGPYLGQPPGVDYVAALPPDVGLLNDCMDAARAACQG